MNRLRTFQIWVGLAGCLALQAIVPVLMGQAVTGSISGSVSDTSGAKVPGVSLSAIHTETGEKHTTLTDAAGDYVFPVLAIGTYRIEGERSGFKKFVREGILLSVNSNVRLDVVLQVGAVSEEVRVAGDAAMVDTRQAQIGALVDTKRVNDLPLNGRNVYDLVSILPGVAKTSFTLSPNLNGDTLNVDGSRSRYSSFMLDGGFNNEVFRNAGNAAPNPDAVEEFRLLTSNYGAEYGRSPGAIINVITKSGTNQLHGSLFEFLRNNHLNARNFFQPTVSPLRQNQFGGTVGGPIIHNRTFFFFSYQGLRNRVGAFGNSAVTPTAAERAGDFSAASAAQRPKDPLTKQPFPAGQIPASRLDPVARKMLQSLVPLPNTPDGRYQVSTPSAVNEDQWLAKIDHQLSTRHKLYGTLFILQGAGLEPFYSGNQIPSASPVDDTSRQRNLVVNEDWTISPSMLNQLRFSYTRRLWDDSTPVRTTWSDWGSNLKLGDPHGRPPQVIVSGRWQMGINTEWYLIQQTPSWSETLNWVHGDHSVKFGAFLLYHRYRENTNWLASGQVRFTGAFTGNALADLMIGEAAQLRQNNSPNRDFRSTDWDNFIQDDWRINRKVTLNLGLRWELNTPFTTPDNSVQTFAFGQASKVIPKAPLGMLFPGDPGIPAGLVRTDWNNFAPRFGIAIDPLGDGKTAVRAGWGIFYAAAYEAFTNSMQGQPFTVDVTVFGTPNLIDPWANVPGGSPFPYVLDRANPLFSLPVTANAMSPNLATPYVQHYNFTIERQIRKDFSLQAAYVGDTSRKLYSQRDINTPMFIPGKSTAANVNGRRPYLPGTFAEISYLESAANAHYDSLQVTANKRFSHGFSVLGSYTLAKSIDDLPEDPQNNADVYMIDSNHRGLERAVSNFDTRHVFIASYMWELPAVRRWGFAGRQILSGWQLNGITHVDSGNAVNVLAGTDTNLDGNSAYDRPDVAGNPRLSTSRPRADLIAKYLNTAAFARVTPGQVGTAGRNLLYGPGSVNFNASAFKIFQLTERKRLEFRAEFFNFFNHTNLGNPNGILTSANFGRILSAASPRIVQFGLKFLF